jgi:ABC-type dipeptide/oligopeptide/nickel transport system permease subunit
MARKRGPSRTRWLVIGIVIGFLLGYVIGGISDPMMLLNDPAGAFQQAFGMGG